MSKYAIIAVVLTSCVSADKSKLKAEEYYKNIDKKATNVELKTQLHDLINPHTVYDYDEVWKAFETVDQQLPGYPCDANTTHIPDIYSSFCWSTDKVVPGGECGNYKKEGMFHNPLSIHICQYPHSIFFSIYR
jgi:hypothetical protein